MDQILKIAKKSVRALNKNGPFSLIGSAFTLINNYAELKLNYIEQRIKYGSSAPNPSQTIQVNPQNIEYMMVPAFSFSKSKYQTYIMGGNWDQQHSSEKISIHRGGHPKKNLVEIENYGFYRSLQNHFKKETPWEKTEFYNWAVEDARKNNIGNHYESMESIRHRLNKIDELYNSIRTEGYKPQQELDHPVPAVNEVQVNIGRRGEIIFDEGKHRFIISKILGIQSIPVRVFVRHEEWQKIRKEVTTASDKKQLNKVARQSLDHPDLANISSHLI